MLIHGVWKLDMYLGFANFAIILKQLSAVNDDFSFQKLGWVNNSSYLCTILYLIINGPVSCFQAVYIRCLSCTSSRGALMITSGMLR